MKSSSLIAILEIFMLNISHAHPFNKTSGHTRHYDSEYTEWNSESHEDVQHNNVSARILNAKNELIPDNCFVDQLLANQPTTLECGKVYSIFNVLNLLALGVDRSDTKNGTKVVTDYYGDSNNNQKFWVSKTGEGFQLAPLSQGIDLMVLDFSRKGNLVLWKAHGKCNQQFVTEDAFEMPSPFVRIKILNLDLFLTSHGISLQVTLEPKSCESWQQLWRIVPIPL